MLLYSYTRDAYLFVTNHYIYIYIYISYEIEFQTEEEAKENELSPSDALLCACLLRRGMVYKLERVLRMCDGCQCSMSATFDGAVLMWLW